MQGNLQTRLDPSNLLRVFLCSGRLWARRMGMAQAKVWEIR